MHKLSIRVDVRCQATDASCKLNNCFLKECDILLNGADEKKCYFTGGQNIVLKS